jgi:hypothetical protein
MNLELVALGRDLHLDAFQRAAGVRIAHFAFVAEFLDGADRDLGPGSATDGNVAVDVIQGEARRFYFTQRLSNVDVDKQVIEQDQNLRADWTFAINLYAGMEF